MKTVLVCILATFLFQYTFCAMTEKQLQATLKLLRNTCQPKSKATNEQIEAMHKGDWDQDKNGQCYMWCIINLNKLITKDNQFDWEGGIAMLSVQAPESIRDPAIATIKNCKDAVKTPEDKCAAGFEIARCIYFDNPEKYFLP